MRLIFPFIILLFLAGCKENRDAGTQQVTVTDTTVLNTILTDPERELIPVPETREITDDWLAYLTAHSEIENFRSHTVMDVSSNATPIAVIMDNLRESSPKLINSHAVETRL